jgi:sterol desaturase/sphingolipid hydroxylase (fatty acid hydroxylase superfamily)
MLHDGLHSLLKNCFNFCMDGLVKLKKFREERRQTRPAWPSGRMHLVANLLFAFSVMVVSWLCIQDISWQVLLLLPLSIFVGTLVEYWGHRSLLHIPRSWLKMAYQEHTLSHHFYFTSQAIEMEKEEDLHFILFNITGLIFFVLILGGALSVVLGFLLGKDFGFFFMGLCGLYFLTYELFHTAYHLPGNHPLLRLSWLRGLRDHHLGHHDQRFMNTHNYGIITSFWDKIFKTRLG